MSCRVAPHWRVSTANRIIVGDGTEHVTVLLILRAIGGDEPLHLRAWFKGKETHHGKHAVRCRTGKLEEFRGADRCRCDDGLPQAKVAGLAYDQRGVGIIRQQDQRVRLGIAQPNQGGAEILIGGQVASVPTTWALKPAAAFTTTSLDVRPQSVFRCCTAGRCSPSGKLNGSYRPAKPASACLHRARTRVTPHVALCYNAPYDFVRNCHDACRHCVCRHACRCRHATATEAAEPVQIGITTPILSGPFADRGQSEQYGAQLALDQINQAGGVLGQAIETFYADNACKPDIGFTGHEGGQSSGSTSRSRIGELSTTVAHASCRS